MRSSDWSSDVCSSDLTVAVGGSPVSWDCARVGRDRHRANRAAAAQRKRVGSMTDSFPGLTSTGNAGARRANRAPSAGPGGAGGVGPDMHPALRAAPPELHPLTHMPEAASRLKKKEERTPRHHTH